LFGAPEVNAGCRKLRIKTQPDEKYLCMAEVVCNEPMRRHFHKRSPYIHSLSTDL